ncbi:myb domain-containing protein [Reticulomyxa filosa]|uniref:Myb domain-containing protein n=1 Tax=Reticulomyxa filosa TaxID=46433 RepID=X6N157_RETFI|nr:myb domain-containing protein [Reticulomyxa filosa]|eukprot:ETO19648.1 myb domain-containing protein [Reticulomyxa filosa]
MAVSETATLEQLNYVNFVMHGFVPGQMAYRKAATAQQRSPNSSVYASTSPHSRMGGIAGMTGMSLAGTPPLRDMYPPLYPTNVNIPQANDSSSDDNDSVNDDNGDDKDKQMDIEYEKQALYPKLHNNNNNNSNNSNVYHFIVNNNNNNNNNNYYYRNGISPKSGPNGMNMMPRYSPSAGTYNDGFAVMKLAMESSRKNTVSLVFPPPPPVHSTADLPHLGFDHFMTIVIVSQSPIPENVKQINAGLHWD